MAIFFIASSSITLADTVRINPGRILDVETTDFNNDGEQDRVILAILSADETELFIYMSVDEISELKPELHKKNIAWRGTMWGTQPSLEVNESGSLIITSNNTSIGRTRWTQNLTIAYRNKRFIVAGYTYNDYDTLKPDSSIDCDVNLLTGKGIKNKKLLRNKPANILLKDWSEKNIPPQCRP